MCWKGDGQRRTVTGETLFYSGITSNISDSYSCVWIIMSKDTMLYLANQYLIELFQCVYNKLSQRGKHFICSLIKLLRMLTWKSAVTAQIEKKMIGPHFRSERILLLKVESIKIQSTFSWYYWLTRLIRKENIGWKWKQYPKIEYFYWYPMSRIRCWINICMYIFQY